MSDNKGLWEDIKEAVLALLQPYDSDSANLKAFQQKALKTWEDKLSSDDAKAHQYLDWALQKREGFIQVGGKWIDVRIEEAHFAKGRLQVWATNTKDGWWIDPKDFQLEPPQPQNLTLDEVRQAIGTDETFYFWNKGDTRIHKGFLFSWDQKSTKEPYVSYDEISGIGRVYNFYANCSRTKPMEAQQ